MDLVDVHYPAWFSGTILATYIYLLVALLIGRHTADARAVVALPILATMTVGCYVAFEVLGFLLWEGTAAGPVVRVAGVADALVPASHGAITSAMLGTTVALARNFALVRQRRSRAASFVLGVSASSVVAWCALMWHLGRWTTEPSNALQQTALVVLGISGTAACLTLVTAFFRVGADYRTGSPRRWFVVFAGLAVLLAVALRVAEDRLRLLAVGG